MAAVRIIEKQRLDSLFSILYRLPAAEMLGLAKDYEDLETRLTALLPHVCDDDPWKDQIKKMIVDIADRTDMLYRFLRNAGHSDFAS